MNDFLEVSSDSSDTIILSPKNNFSLSPKQLDNEDSDVEALVKKYIAENALQRHAENTIVVENRYNDKDLDVPIIKRLKKSNDIEFPNSRSFSNTSSSSQEDDANDVETIQTLHNKYKQTKEDKCNQIDVLKENIKPLNYKKLKKQEHDLLKQEKFKEKEQKKKEAKQEKIIKQGLAAAYKNVKPTECIKFITVSIDSDISKEEYGNEIINALQGVGVQYKVQSQIFPHTISWIRNMQAHLLDDNGKLVLNSEDQGSKEILLIMNCKEFVEHINNNTLSGCIQSLQAALVNKIITLVIYGLHSYFRYLKNHHQREWRTQVADENKSQTSKTFFDDFPKVTKSTIENKLTELQLLCSCSHRLVDSASEMGLLVAQFTKAVAEIPFKLQRYEKFQQTEWFVAGDNRDCVKVDKNGNGLNRLWKQMLTTFPLARLETAEAISSKYPTVTSLMTAYQKCKSTNEAELLLQDIPIRRAAGPLSSTRRIGPELSKKCFNFFTSTDGDTLI